MSRPFDIARRRFDVDACVKGEWRFVDGVEVAQGQEGVLWRPYGTFSGGVAARGGEKGPEVHLQGPRSPAQQRVAHRQIPDHVLSRRISPSGVIGCRVLRFACPSSAKGSHHKDGVSALR